MKNYKQFIRTGAAFLMTITLSLGELASTPVLAAPEEDTAQAKKEEEVTGVIPDLTVGQLETADALKDELKYLEESTSDDNYVKNEACFYADTEEYAREVAGLYNAELLAYSNGVAKIGFKEKPIEEVYEEMIDDVKTVETAVETVRAGMESLDGASEEPVTIGAVASIDEELAQKVSAIDVSELPDVPVYVNRRSHLQKVTPSDDPLYTTSGSDTTRQWFHSAVDTAGAWEAGADGTGVKVAILDTGVDTSNPDLKGSDHLEALHVDDAQEGITGDEDDDGHGTHCAGIVAGLDNTYGGLGIAPNAKLITIRIGTAKGTGMTDYDISSAVNLAIEKGAKVISMSYSSTETSTMERQAMQKAYNAGIVLVAAAGNDGNSTKNYPAAYDEVISVGASGPGDKLADYSNFGSWVDLAAPGTDIWATRPDDGKCDKGFEDTNRDCAYGKLSGTSMSTPLVAGVAALVLSAHPEYTPDQVKSVLISSAADKTYSYGSNKVTGGVNAGAAIKNQSSIKAPVIKSEVTDSSTGAVKVTITTTDEDVTLYFSEDGKEYSEIENGWSKEYTAKGSYSISAYAKKGDETSLITRKSITVGTTDEGGGSGEYGGGYGGGSGSSGSMIIIGGVKCKLDTSGFYGTPDKYTATPKGIVSIKKNGTIVGKKSGTVTITAWMKDSYGGKGGYGYGDEGYGGGKGGYGYGDGGYGYGGGGGYGGYSSAGYGDGGYGYGDGGYGDGGYGNGGGYGDGGYGDGGYGDGGYGDGGYGNGGGYGDGGYGYGDGGYGYGNGGYGYGDSGYGYGDGVGEYDKSGKYVSVGKVTVTVKVPKLNKVKLETDGTFDAFSLTNAKNHKAFLEGADGLGAPTWSSSKGAVATIDAGSGLITVNGNGKTKITADFGSKKIKTTLTVKLPSISKKSARVKVGRMLTLKVKRTSAPVTWSSSDTSVATIDNTGTVVGLAPGIATIKAEVQGLSKPLECQVYVLQ